MFKSKARIVNLSKKERLTLISIYIFLMLFIIKLFIIDYQLENIKTYTEKVSELKDSYNSKVILKESLSQKKNKFSQLKAINMEEDQKLVLHGNSLSDLLFFRDGINEFSIENVSNELIPCEHLKDKEYIYKNNKLILKTEYSKALDLISYINREALSYIDNLELKRIGDNIQMVASVKTGEMNSTDKTNLAFMKENKELKEQIHLDKEKTIKSSSNIQKGNINLFTNKLKDEVILNSPDLIELSNSSYSRNNVIETPTNDNNEMDLAKGHFKYDLINFNDNQIVVLGSSPNSIIDYNQTSETISKKTGMIVKYNLKNYEEGFKIYIDFNYSEKLDIEYPANYYSMWINSYNLSPCKVFLSYTNNYGENKEIEILNKTDFIGWREIKFQIHDNLDSYPLEINQFIIQNDFNKEIKGSIVFDRLYGNYLNVKDSLDNFYYFYTVRSEKTIEDIVKNYYGDLELIQEIRKINEIYNNEPIKVGTIITLIAHKGF